MDRRQLEEAFFKGLMIASTVIIVGILFAILAVVLLKGAPLLSLSMLTQTPKGGYYLGKGGGILNAIIGSLYLAFGATFLSFIIAFPIALYLQEYARNRFASFVRLSLDILWGVPSIVYGAFGFTIMLYLGLRACLLGGIIVLTLLMLPIMTRAMDEVMRMVPHELRETSYAVGSTRLEALLRVVSRQALPGILTAVLLAFGRGIGDAASILFTAGYTDHIPHSLFDPAASLPLAVFFLLGTPLPEVQERAYAAAVILLVIILSTSVISRLLTTKWTKFVIK
ncbi:MAG: phosphate ABC transporter permease PstA [Methanophagales archaeon ANME-1-THS]|nr:MAG: phosphate ABC transporter permease PstA [Methanophagales archaeon ANME-1-THS]